MRCARQKRTTRRLSGFFGSPAYIGGAGAAREEDFKVLDDENIDRKYATPSDVQAAIEQLGLSPRHKVYRAARVLMSGSEFQNPWELLNEAVKRCMQAAVDREHGRPWPLDGKRSINRVRAPCAGC